MSTVAAESVTRLTVDPNLLRAVTDSVSNALTMCNARARCVGISSVPPVDGGDVTGMIGIHGKVSGFVTVNVGNRCAVRLVEGLLQDQFGALSPQVIDGMGEITNIIVGGIKSAMSSTDRAFSHITVPSVIVGRGYQIAYAKGLDFLCVAFEHHDPESLVLQDRLLQVSLSMLRL
ncbi:MAG: chemotaxis protein CheX [Pirellulales bacterium]|nr:chemotaxis protein CheX [Pirellulales bacterium]